MYALIRSLAVPIASLILLMLGSGYFMTFLSIWLDSQGVHDEWIGALASAFYGGILLGSLYSPGWIHRLGHGKTLSLVCALVAMTILAMGFWFHPLYWILVRFLAGVGVGALFVAIESWFLLASAPSMRSQALSVYLIVLYGALSFGQLLIGIVNLKGCFPFLLGAGLCTLALLPIVFVKTSPPLPQHPAPYTLLQSFRSSPRGFFGGVVSGIVLACVYGLGPAFGQQIGLAAADTGTFMAALIFGGLSLQWPLGKWADCSSRKRVLLFASLCSALFSLLIALFASASWPLLLALAWLFGGAAYVIYPLSMAFTCEALEECQIVAATGGFVLSYGIGAVAGPLAAPPFMAWLGPQGLFYFIAAVCLLLALISIPSRKR